MLTACESNSRVEGAREVCRSAFGLSAGSVDFPVTGVLLDFLTFAAHEMSLIIDRAAARRALAIASNDSSAGPFDVGEGARQLLHSASAFGMRIDALSVSATEATEMVRFGAPVGALWCNSGGELNWLLLIDRGNGDVQLLDSASPGEPRSWSPSTIGALLDGRVGEVQWLSLQASLPCDSLASDQIHDRTPFSRFLTLLAPEKSDIVVILVFGLFVGLLALSTPIAVESLVNTVAFGQFIQPVVVLAMMLFVFMAFSASLRAVQTYVAEIIQRRLFVRVATDLAYRIPRVHPAYWQSHYGPEAVNRFFEIVTVQKVTTQLLLDGTSLILQTLVGMTVIAFYHPILLGFDAFLLVLMGIIVFLLGRNAVKTSTDESREKYATAAWLEELARHPTLFRSRGGLEFALDRADQFITHYLSARAEHFRILMRQIVCALFVQAIASTVLLGLGGWLVIRGELTLGQLVAAELIVTLIVGSFAKIGKQLEGFYDVMASMDKLGHLFDMPLERSHGLELPRREVGIAVGIHDLTLSPLVTGQAIKDVSLSVEPGQHWSVVGELNGLRSRLLEAIAGFELGLSGHVELDGTDIRRVRLDCVRDQVVLLRDVEVFAGTVAENLHVGRHGVREDDVRNALQSVDLLDTVLDLPRGLETVVQTDGAQFSSDQLVQLMLARALAGCPRLLLIDGLLDRLSDTALRRVMPGLRSPGFDVTLLVATGRSDVSSYFDRQLILSPDGTLRPSSAGHRLTTQSRKL